MDWAGVALDIIGPPGPRTRLGMPLCPSVLPQPLLVVLKPPDNLMTECGGSVLDESTSA